jgi:hypothetical protein
MLHLARVRNPNIGIWGSFFLASPKTIHISSHHILESENASILDCTVSCHNDTASLALAPPYLHDQLFARLGNLNVGLRFLLHQSPIGIQDDGWKSKTNAFSIARRGVIIIFFIFVFLSLLFYIQSQVLEIKWYTPERQPNPISPQSTLHHIYTFTNSSRTVTDIIFLPRPS